MITNGPAQGFHQLLKGMLVVENRLKPAVLGVLRDPHHGRLGARFNPANKILLFYKNAPMKLRNVSEEGFQIEGDGFLANEIHKFDLVFTDEAKVCGLRVRAQCMWTTQGEAGFRFIAENAERALSSRIARMYLRSANKSLDGTAF